MLEVVADTVYSNVGSKEGGGRRNEHVLRRLLEQLHTTMAIYHVWGSPFLGGGHLMKQHRDTRRKITGFVEKMQVRVSIFKVLTTLLKRNAIDLKIINTKFTLLLPYYIYICIKLMIVKFNT